MLSDHKPGGVKPQKGALPVLEAGGLGMGLNSLRRFQGKLCLPCPAACGPSTPWLALHHSSLRLYLHLAVPFVRTPVTGLGALWTISSQGPLLSYTYEDLFPTRSHSQVLDGYTF